MKNKLLESKASSVALSGPGQKPRALPVLQHSVSQRNDLRAFFKLSLTKQTTGPEQVCGNLTGGSDQMKIECCSQIGSLFSGPHILQRAGLPSGVIVPVSVHHHCCGGLSDQYRLSLPTPHLLIGTYKYIIIILQVMNMFLDFYYL